MDPRPGRPERIRRREALLERRLRLRMLRNEVRDVSDSSSESAADEVQGDDHFVAVNDQAPVILNDDENQSHMNDQSSSHNDANSDVDSDGENSSDEDDNQSDSDDELDEEFNPELYLFHSLREWAMRGVPKRKVDSLLNLLRPVHPSLPKSYKTLLSTPRCTDVQEVENGHVWYKGIKKSLNERITQEYLDTQEYIVIDINMDGLPLYRNGKAHFWPILGALKDQFNTPFIIAVYFGFHSKPSTLHQFLNDFVAEVLDLRENGFNFHGNVYRVSLRHFICDAPARSMVKCAIGHNGTFGCEKCEVRGQWIDRTTFLSTTAQLRTDDSFRDRRNPLHHKGTSPLEDVLGIGMVSQFRLDPQHLMYLGIVKKILKKKFETRNQGRLADDQILEFKEALQNLGLSFPREFNRKPKFFDKVNELKAAELRRFVLYEGIKALKGILPADEYNNFLLLHCVAFILESPCFVQRPAMVDAAEEFAKLFVRFSKNLYGQEFLVYNVHSLIHMAQECRLTQQHLYAFSCFPFENYLKTIKFILRSGYQPLQQLARRDTECEGKLEEPKEIQKEVSLKLHHHDPLEEVLGEQYQMLTMEGLTLCLNQSDKCFRTKDGTTVILTNIIQTEENSILLRGKRFQMCQDYYNYPVDSSDLGIIVASELSENIETWILASLACKCILLPETHTSFLCIPMLHTTTS